MATRRDRSTEIRDLASTVFRLMREREIATTSRLKVNSALSRILQHAPEWRALRLRTKAASTRTAKEPSFFTIVEAAKELNVPLCALVPTIDHQPLTEPQREVLTLFARWSLANFARRDDERAAYTSDFEDFTAYVTIRKQAYGHAADSRIGTDVQAEPEDVEVLASIKGIGDDRLQVIRVRGDSMVPRLHDGDQVLVDVHRRSPRTGEMVAVDRHHVGRTIGYWRQERGQFFLDKENDTTIDLGRRDDFTILGTVTAIVWAPLKPRERTP
jgi:phage repressor protein C with HTH and peptisase S24 domain